jgi:hypothetical protein
LPVTKVAKIIERGEAHYEIRDVEMGKIYRWYTESIVLRCRCGERLSLTVSINL